MPARLNSFYHKLIVAKIREGLSDKAIAEDVSSLDRKVHPRAVSRIRQKLARYGTPTAPPARTGPDPKITPIMVESLLHRLSKEQGMTRLDMVKYIWDRFGVDTSVTSITRVMQSRDITWKIMRRVAQQQNPELKHFYWRLLHMAKVKAKHCVFIDESGINPPDTFQPKGWAKKGITPIQRERFQRENRVQILSAYTLKGIKLSRVYTGSTDKTLFEDFIEQLLRHCGRWPEPESVLLMDNASFHFSAKIEQMCEEAGVDIFMTAPYTPRTDPIEEHFGVFKTLARCKRKEQTGLRTRSFESYVKACIESLKYRGDIAEGHFRNAGFYIKPHD